MTIDTLIVAGILISGGAMALLPILKDPVDREKKTRWLIGKFNWVAYTIIGLFIFGVSLGILKENRDRNERAKERNLDRADIAKQVSEASKNNTNELSKTKQYIVDSMTRIFKRESERQKGQMDSIQTKNKKQMDSIEASRQRRLTAIDKSRLLQRINNTIKENHLEKNNPITVDRPMGNPEAGVFAHEVFDFLKSMGYKLIFPPNSIGDGFIGESAGNELKGFWVHYEKNTGLIYIDVGAIKSKP